MHTCGAADAVGIGKLPRMVRPIVSGGTVIMPYMERMIIFRTIYRAFHPGGLAPFREGTRLVRARTADEALRLVRDRFPQTGVEVEVRAVPVR